MAEAQRWLRRRLCPEKTIEVERYTEDIKARFGGLIHQRHDHIAIMPSVAYAMASICANTTLVSGQKILCLKEQFASSVLIWSRAARGQEIPVIQIDSEHPTDALLNAMDAYTQLMVLPHVHWSRGQVLDLEVICQKARTLNIKVVLDLSQFVGVLEPPGDGVYAICAVASKWLLGPYSTALCYLSDELCAGQPLEETWFGGRHAWRAGGDTFEQRVCHPGAARFDMGQFDDPVRLGMLSRSLELITDVGPARIRQHCQRWLEPIRLWLDEHGLAHHCAPHMLFIKNAPGDSVERLRALNVVCSMRADNLRLSPHLYNDEHDQAAVLCALEHLFLTG